MRMIVILSAALWLVGCGSAGPPTGNPSETLTAYDIVEPEPSENPPPTQSRIAYIYRLGFALPAAQIPAAQRKHVALCERLGSSRCQLLASERSGGDTASGSLRLRVDARLAKSFSAALEQAVAGEGGRTSDSAVEAEDLSKQMVDSEARLRQRTLLVERLTELLRDRRGSVGDLVAAEKAVADAQEQLDQAKGWLAELRGRVAMSTFEISYSSRTPAADGSFGALLDESRDQLLTSLRALLTFAIVALPWIVVLIGLGWAFRRWRRQRRRARHLPEV